MKTGGAVILSASDEGVRVSAASARISTTEGNALSAFEKGDGAERDLKLIRKVLASGHRTIVEHQTYTIAFHDVSVLAEELLIECRLASYTVKSRRYVNFSGAGYIGPEGLSEAEEAAFRANMDARFETYEQLLALGIPREDARFVLPYCFKSNFYMTLNARELAHVIASMLNGRMSLYPEMRRLGESLKAQLDARFPGVLDAELKDAPVYHRASLPAEPTVPHAVHSSVDMRPAFGAKDALDQAMRFSGRFEAEDYRALVRDARPRELETISYGFTVQNISLACVTHFARHRMQTLLAPDVETALLGGGYVLPDTVTANPDALILYTRAFEDNARAAKEMLDGGAPREALAYYALAGCTVDILTVMNARELLHFLKLRTCSRAQWEIRRAAEDMLARLQGNFPQLFRLYGPGCAVTGRCPEGRLSCGRIRKTEE